MRLVQGDYGRETVFADDARVYFVHSYYVETPDPSIVATTTSYGIDFVSSAWRGNVFATQFHPEKSQARGLQVYRNFAAVASRP